MIDISTYRCRIGTFTQLFRIKKSRFINRFDRVYQDSSGNQALKCLQNLMKFILLVIFISSCSNEVNTAQLSDLHGHVTGHARVHVPGQSGKLLQEGQLVQWGQLCLIVGRKLTVNFLARYTYGNIEVKRGIKNLHLNIRSLANKISEVKNIVKEQRPHVLGLSECELRKVSNKFDENKLKIPGYDLIFPKSWSQHGFARVVIYVKKTLEYQHVQELQDDLVQSVWLKAGFKNGKKFYICHGYREHTSTLGASLGDQRKLLEKFLAQWEEALAHNNPSEANEVHISCDMNLDALGNLWLEPAYHLVTLSRLVQAACNLGDFSQLVTLPTRFQYNSVKDTTAISCIDHVYTNRKYRCSSVSVIPFGGSDHDIVSYTRFTKAPPSPARTIRKRSYKNFVQEEFLHDIAGVDWTEVYHCKDVDSAAAVFTRKFVQVLNGHAPWILYQQRKHYSPWLTEETQKLMKERDEFKKQAEYLASAGESRSAAEAWVSFKKVRNKVNNRKKYEERNYKSEKMTQSLDSPANTWRTAKSFMDWEHSGGPPHQLRVGSKLITKASSIASEMNNFFIQKVKKIREGIIYLPNLFLQCKEIMRNKSCRFAPRHVSVDKVNKLLKNLKNSRSTSIDELDNFCVKIAANEIDKPLHHIITLSLIERKFPSSWKYSKVIPLHKKDCKLECKNYRPVAILSPLSKILEKVVYEELYNYFTRNKIFHPNLHGYRHGRSTQTALLTMYDRWVKAAAAKQVSGVILLDLSAAFDLVDPELLVSKLRIYGVEEEGLDWIHSYLTGRYQAVWLDHVLSDFIPCDVGVPQGSILGPLLFLIFFNDLPPTLDSEVDSYADDTTITATGKSVNHISRILTQDCTRVSQWMRSNRLKLNPDKTHVMTVGTKERVRSLTEQLEVTMDNTLLEEDKDKCEFLLGCHMQANLKWKKQLFELQSKLGKRLVGLFKLKFIVPYPVRKAITEGIFNSVLVYCLALFGGMDLGDLRDLQVMQNKAAQIVTHSPPRAERTLMYNRLNWLTVNQLVFYHSVITVFKIRENKEPEHLAEIVTRDSRNKRIVVPNTDLTLAQKSFTFRGSNNWNQLPLNIRSSQGIGLFKKLAKKWIYENVPRFLD